jgi:hypothetical protein
MDPRHPVLFVSWRSRQNRSIYPVGRLIYLETKGLYEFVYIAKAQEAARQGFLPFLEFPDLTCLYLSQKLYPLFANRVLSTNRPEFGEYIEALGLSAETANPMLILARTGGRRETDQIEMFPLPFPARETGSYVTHCLLRAIQYMQPGVEDRIARLAPNEPLFLLWDVQNEVDPSAIAVRTKDCALLGYLPAYLTRDVWKLNSSCSTCHVFVERVNLPPAGIHQRLLCRIEGCWPPGFIPYATEEYEPLFPEATNLKEWIQPQMAQSWDDSAVMDPPTVSVRINH